MESYPSSTLMKADLVRLMSSNACLTSPDTHGVYSDVELSFFVANVIIISAMLLRGRLLSTRLLHKTHIRLRLGVVVLRSMISGSARFNPLLLSLCCERFFYYCIYPPISTSSSKYSIYIFDEVFAIGLVLF